MRKLIIILLTLGMVLFGCMGEETEPAVEPSSAEADELDSNCDSFPENLESCTEYKCEFLDPLTKQHIVREIFGIVDGKCRYTEEIANNRKMECNCSEEMRRELSQYYRYTAVPESLGLEVFMDGNLSVSRLIVDGKVVENSLHKATDSGQCVITGYGMSGHPPYETDCPPGAMYLGQTYIYENGEQVPHPVCSDPDMVCPPCENCASGQMEKGIDSSGEVCRDCTSDSDCKEGFSCVMDKCLNISSQGEGSPCEWNSDCSEGSFCAPGDVCVDESILD